MTNNKYEIEKQEQSIDGVKFIFNSHGSKNVVKAIEYALMTHYNGMNVYNLGFGDIDFEFQHINDCSNTKNGDIYIVLNTVLHSIPIFFESFPNAAIFIQGSDSSDDFVRKCRMNCKKNCELTCKNQHRRMRAYKYYLNKNFHLLTDEYRFFGEYLNEQDTQPIIEGYIPHKNYKSILVIKNKM